MKSIGLGAEKSAGSGLKNNRAEIGFILYFFSCLKLIIFCSYFDICERVHNDLKYCK